MHGVTMKFKQTTCFRSKLYHKYFRYK